MEMQYISYEDLSVDDITLGPYMSTIYQHTSGVSTYENTKLFHKNKNLTIEGCEVECSFINKKDHLSMEYCKDKTEDCKYINKIAELYEKINKENNNITGININTRWLLDNKINTEKKLERVALSPLISVVDADGNPIDIDVLGNRKFTCIPVIEYINIFKSNNKCSISRKIRSLIEA